MNIRREFKKPQDRTMMQDTAGYVYFDCLEDGTDGIDAASSEVTGEYAATEIKVRVKNASKEVQSVTVRALLLDAEGIFTAGDEQITGIDAGDTVTIALTLRFSDPVLSGEGIEPYNYTLYVSLAAGECKDTRTSFVCYHS